MRLAGVAVSFRSGPSIIFAEGRCVNALLKHRATLPPRTQIDDFLGR